MPALARLAPALALANSALAQPAPWSGAALAVDDARDEVVLLWGAGDGARLA